VNADLSVAPEIAWLAAPFVLPPYGSAVHPPRTVGRVAGELTRLAAAPQRWWDLVRFDPDGPARVPVPDDGDAWPSDAWLLVVPPGAVTECDCAYGTLIAGEATDGSRPLRPGRVLVHGTRAPHMVRGVGHGYSVSLHAGREGRVGKRQLPGTDGGSSPDDQGSPQGCTRNHHYGRRGDTRDPAHWDRHP
jgi:hypothetical protein